MAGAHAWTLFDTEVGPVGIAWSHAGVAGIQLPEDSLVATRSRLSRRFAQAEETSPPAAIRAAIAAIQSLLRGEPANLDFIALDLQGVSDFERRVYDIARAIPPSATITYGDIATQLGDVQLSRAVGQALGHNPIAIIIPCHRVLAAGGKPGGFSANGGVATKMRLLAIESRQGSLGF